MLSQEVPEDETRWSARSTATRLLRELDVETALRIVQAELPDYDTQVLNWHRPKRDYPPPD
jgi:hypothetical protein